MVETGRKLGEKNLCQWNRTLGYLDQCRLEIICIIYLIYIAQFNLFEEKVDNNFKYFNRFVERQDKGPHKQWPALNNVSYTSLRAQLPSGLVL
jgi:hypothetical protein